MVPRSRNARGLRTPYVLVDPPCVHPKGLTWSASVEANALYPLSCCRSRDSDEDHGTPMKTMGGGGPWGLSSCLLGFCGLKGPPLYQLVTGRLVLSKYKPNGMLYNDQLVVTTG